jgi:alanine dehydrogenase
MNKGNNVTVELVIGSGEIAVDGKFEAVVCSVVDDVAHVFRLFFACSARAAQ